MTNSPVTSGVSQDEAIRILVVEDEPHVRRLISRRLQQAGFNVVTAATGEDALRMFPRDGLRVDFLITDGIMPGMDGFELARHFGRYEPPVPAVLISGFLGHFAGRKDMPGNLEAFFPKPFSGEDLVAHVLERFGAPA